MEPRIEESSCCVQAMVRGYHEYESVWSVKLGEKLSCVRERGNLYDVYAVAIMKSSTVFGHVPRKISSICSVFIRRGGTIHCQATGSRRYSSDLAQGGLEIPCVLEFFGETKDVHKVGKLATLALLDSSDILKGLSSGAQPPAKKMRVCPSLKEEERKRIRNGEMLSDVSINWAQQIIKDQFPHLGGLQSSLLLQKTTIDVSVEDKIQIIHC